MRGFALEILEVINDKAKERVPSQSEKSGEALDLDKIFAPNS